MTISKLMRAFRPVVLAGAVVVGMCAWADYPTQDIISLNMAQQTSDTYKMSGSGETTTLAGTLPDSAWHNTRHSNGTQNGTDTGIAAWNGTSQQVETFSDLRFTYLHHSGDLANFGTSNELSPKFQRSWLGRGNSGSGTVSILVQNIPYERYDVILYFSGKSGSTFKAVCLNGIPYVGDTAAENGTAVATGNKVTWGGQQAEVVLGRNALKFTGLVEPMLALKMFEVTNFGISALQIVRDMSAIGTDTRPTSSKRVISVNLQSRYNTNGFTWTDKFGLERVPAAAWTDDGLSSASDGGANVSVPVKEWNGETRETTELSDVTINEKAANAYSVHERKAYNGVSLPVANVLNSYLDDGGNQARITVENVPYKKYDVIVYCATDSDNYYFAPVSVNGSPYRWSTGNRETQIAGSASSTSATTWGYSNYPVPALGANAIRVTGQTSSTLTITGGNNANTARGGIAAFQIVDTYDPSAVSSVTIEDGGTYAIEAALTEAVRLVCEGSLTIAGANGYTVVNDDLAKLDLDGVTGTVTLGANTCYELGANRTLPAGFVFGDGSAVAISESVEEYAKDEFSVSGLTGVSKVVLTRYDGTTEQLEVTDGTASFGNGEYVKVTGLAALYDFTFTNTFATAAGSRKSVELNHSTANWILDGDNNPVASSLTSRPWVSMAPEMANWNEFSTAVAGTMPSGTKTMFISFGSASNSGKTRYALFLATGAAENEVDVCYGNESSSTVLTTMTVPNAATARHFYGFVVSDNRTKLTIYLDGMKWKTVTRTAGFQLGTADHGGIQCGSAFGGLPSGYSGASNGDIYTLLVYDYLLSAQQIEKLQELYPYNSPHGSYERDVSGAETFSSADSWTKAGESDVKYDVPEDGASVSLRTLTDAEVEVNATLSLESLTLEGDGALTLKKGDGLLTSAGLTTIATDVTIEAGAADISGAPTVITEGGTLKFDYSAFDLFKYSAETLVPLTGELEQQAEGVVTCVLPECDATREHTSEFLYTNGCYQLRVVPREGRDVYLPAGTTVFTDDTEVTWTEEGEEATEVTGFAIATDTVHFSAADTVTVNRTIPVVGYDFGEFAGKLVLSSGEAEELILSQPITGAGTVEIASGVVQSRGSFAADIDVASGAVLKLGSVGGFGATDNGATPSGKTITVAGEVELNGVRDSCNAFTLAGGTLRNTGSEIPTGNRQTTALTLTANSTVQAGSDFGLVGSGYAETTLNLGGNTLTKTGDAKFWLYNTRSEESGTIDIKAGSVDAYSTVSLPNVDFKIAEGASLKIRTSNFSGGNLSGTGTVDLSSNRPEQALKFAEGSSLAVKIVLANTTEDNIRIPYTGRPGEVKVYEPNGTDVSTASTVSVENGYIVVSVNVANRTRANPVTGASKNFDYVFLGTQDATWESTGNWYSAVGDRWSQYTDSSAPNITRNYSPVLFDGDFIEYDAGQDGYKTVSNTTPTEGWALKIGLYNGVKVSIATVKKMQSNTESGPTEFYIDSTSKLVMGRNNRSGNSGGTANFYVAGAEGLEFTTDFHFGGNTVSYYLAGEGSVKYADGLTTGTHQIMVVKLPAGNPPSKLKKLIKRKLVSFGSGSSVTFSLGPTVTYLEKTPNVEPLTMSPYSGEGNLTTEADFGTYQLTQETDGVYITYVGYGKPFYLFLR